VPVLKRLAAADPNVKIIVNSATSGTSARHFHAFCQARGDCVISIVADLQDPPEMIAEMVREWGARQFHGGLREARQRGKIR